MEEARDAEGGREKDISVSQSITWSQRSKVTLTATFEVLLLGLLLHQRASRTCGVHVPRQRAHVEGRETIGGHGARRIGVAERCRRRERERDVSEGYRVTLQERKRGADVQGLLGWRLCDLAADWSGWYVL